jgi:hypothetical protein
LDGRRLHCCRSSFVVVVPRAKTGCILFRWRLIVYWYRLFGLDNRVAVADASDGDSHASRN